jgi:hypothetical protein
MMAIAKAIAIAIAKAIVKRSDTLHGSTWVLNVDSCEVSYF